MKWNSQASEAINKVPFFVRKRVKGRVEEEDKGFQVETCFGPTGCPNRAVITEGLADELERLLAQKELKAFLKGMVDVPLKMHHEFRVSISDCPNACSRPQIVDIGLIGASRPVITEQACTQCQACLQACKESAVVLKEKGPQINFYKCLYCGSCIRQCPTGTIAEQESGYRVLIGGKLGRHPRLAQDLNRIFPTESIPAVIDVVVEFYKKNCRRGERLGAIVEVRGLEPLLVEMKNEGLLT